MLRNDFYSVVEKHKPTGEKGTQVRICFDRSHRVFQGHFPQVPVVPGVCLIQVVQELTEEILQEKLVLVNGTNIKFLTPINPDIHPEVSLDIQAMPGEDQMIKVSATCNFDSVVFMKLRAGFRSG